MKLLIINLYYKFVINNFVKIYIYLNQIKGSNIHKSNNKQKEAIKASVIIFYYLFS